jgi:hypothetical protein
MIKMCCFVILTDKNFVNNYFNVFKNIDAITFLVELIYAVVVNTYFLSSGDIDPC